MFKKLLAGIGIGAAQVDTIVETEHFVPGGIVEGRVEIRGGDVEQNISEVTLDLMTEVKHEVDDSSQYVETVIDSYSVCGAFVVQAKEEVHLPFRFILNPETPVTSLATQNNACHVWLKTALDIDLAMDPTDKDFLNIATTPAIQHFIDAMHNNNFVMVKADVENGYLQGNGFASTTGFYQELEFKPSGFGRVQEVELSFITGAHQTHVLVEVDRRFSGDGYRSLSVSHDASYAEVEQQLRGLF